MPVIPAAKEARQEDQFVNSLGKVRPYLNKIRRTGDVTEC
jgi:hypothetical protein